MEIYVDTSPKLYPSSGQEGTQRSERKVNATAIPRALSTRASVGNAGPRLRQKAAGKIGRDVGKGLKVGGTTSRKHEQGRAPWTGSTIRPVSGSLGSHQPDPHLQQVDSERIPLCRKLIEPRTSVSDRTRPGHSAHSPPHTFPRGKGLTSLDMKGMAQQQAASAKPPKHAASPTPPTRRNPQPNLADAPAARMSPTTRPGVKASGTKGSPCTQP